MSETNESSSRAILIAAITGAAVGAGVALLFAPRSGRETREWLAERGSELKQKTTRAYEQGMDAVRQKVSGATRTEDGDIYNRQNTSSNA